MTDANKHDTQTADFGELQLENCDLKKIATDRMSGQSLTRVDYERYAHFLEGLDASEEEKREFAQIVWNIVFSIASLGFKAHPVQVVQKICGKAAFSAAARSNLSRQMVE